MPIAIDWGNSNTVVAYRVRGNDHLFAPHGSSLIPSFSSYDDNGNLLCIGIEARNHLATGINHVVAGVKRLIGVGYDSRIAEWANRTYGLNLLDQDGRFKVQVGNTVKSPEEIALEFFGKLKEMLAPQVAQEAGVLDHLLGRARIRDCVVTCPAHYYENQRNVLRNCLNGASLVLLDNQLIPEPQAASYMLESLDGNNLIIDWGGGTLDYILIDNNRNPIHLAATQTDCGGIDMDLAILDGLLAARSIAGLAAHDRAVARLLIEGRKEALLGNPPPTLPPLIAELSGGVVDLTFTRAELLDWIQPVLNRVVNSLMNLCRELRNHPIQKCVLIGGPVQADPIVDPIRQILRRLGNIPCEVLQEPMTAVARGALRRVVRNDQAPILLPHDYGVMVDLEQHHMGPVLLRAQTPCPAESDEREVELRGTPGTPVELAIWVRKADLAHEKITYESTTTFTFLPKFNQQARAKIRVALQADAAGVITAQVTDDATNQRITLQKVGAAISKRMSGPPCRSFEEIHGLLLQKCWHAYLLGVETNIGNLLVLLRQGHKDQAPNARQLEENAEKFENHIKKWLGIGEQPEDPEQTLQELWHSACRVARLSLAEAGKHEPPTTAVSNAVQEIDERLTAQPNPVSKACVRDLLNRVGRLHEALVRIIGERHVLPVLNGCNLNDNDLQQRVGLLRQILNNFNQNQYGRLVGCWAEISAILTSHNADQNVQSAFNPVMKIVRLRAHAEGILFRLDISEEGTDNAA